MKLISLKLPDLPYLGSTGLTQCDRPNANLLGWSVRVRGLAVFLVSPPGWAPGVPLPNRKPDGPRRQFGPLSGVVLEWEGDDAPESMQKYDSLPMMPPAPAISDEELERATAPKKAVAR